MIEDAATAAPKSDHRATGRATESGWSDLCLQKLERETTTVDVPETLLKCQSLSDQGPYAAAGTRPARWPCGSTKERLLDGHVAWSGASGSDRSERLCAEPAGGGRVIVDDQHLVARSRRRRSWRRSAPRPQGGGIVAEADHIPAVRFGKDDRKIDRMRPYLARQAATALWGGRDRTAKEFRTCRRVRNARATTDPVVFVHQGRPR